MCRFHAVLTFFGLSLGIFILFIEPGGAFLVADSMGDFSGTQGQDNWFYGYYDRESDPDSIYDASSDFQLMLNFGVLGGYVGPQNNWYIHATNYWTRIWNYGGIPNGPITSGGRAPDEHWAVRRWVAEAAGSTIISGSLAKADGGGGDGVTGRIFVDGVSVWSQAIAGTDTGGVTFEVNVSLDLGSTVDFVISPNASDYWDSTLFTGKIDMLLPIISVSPTSIVFNNQDIDSGATSPMTAAVRNAGATDLLFTGSGIQITGLDASEFVITNSPSTAPLPSSATRDVLVAFDPSSVGLKSASLTITSNDPDEPTSEVALSGTGIQFTPTPTSTATFTATPTLTTTPIPMPTHTPLPPPPATPTPQEGLSAVRDWDLYD